MSDAAKTSPASNRRRLRTILLLLTLITLPFGCCGGTYLLDLLPAALLPPAADFALNLFETGARVENRSGETLYLTPITTTYGHPRVIPQSGSIRQREFPLPPNQSMALTYDAADMPLSGIAVCRPNTDCRLLAVDYSNIYTLDSFEALPVLDPAWLLAIQAHPQYSFAIVLFLAVSLLPATLFASWLYLGWQEKQTAG